MTDEMSKKRQNQEPYTPQSDFEKRADEVNKEPESKNHPMFVSSSGTLEASADFKDEWSEPKPGAVNVQAKETFK